MYVQESQPNQRRSKGRMSERMTNKHHN